MRRRQVVVGTGIMLATTIAGCVGDDGPDDGGTATETNETATDVTDDESENETDGDSETETEGDGEAGADGDDASDDAAATGDDHDEGDEEDQSEDDPFDGDDDSPIQGLRVTEDTLVEDNYSTSIVGTIVNDSGEDLASIEVAGAFSDADGDRIDENSTSVGSMDDGDELPIEITSFEDDIVDYEVAIVEAKPHEQIFG